MVYIAGPFTQGDTPENVKKAILVGAEIRDSLDIITFVPHFTFYEALFRPRDYEYWMAIDFDVVKRCDAIFRMPGHSPGADREEILAAEIGIPVFYNIETLKEWVDNWKLARNSV